MINKSYSFTTEITPETEVLLSGRHGQPLTMRFTDASSSMSVTMDTESIIRLQAFLSDYLLQDDAVNAVPVYVPTGRALAVIDGDTLDIVKVFVADKVVGLDNSEEEPYESLAEKVMALTDTQLPPKALFVFFDLFNFVIDVDAKLILFEIELLELDQYCHLFFQCMHSKRSLKG